MVKLHFGLDADGYLPMLIDMIVGKKHGIDWVQALVLPAGSYMSLIVGIQIANTGIALHSNEKIWL